MIFKKFKDYLTANAKKGNDIIYIRQGYVQIFTSKGFYPVITALLRIQEKPASRMIFDSKKVRFYFQKPDIPYEFDYTSFEFELEESINVLLSPFIVAMYPNAREVHSYLKDMLDVEEREKKI